MSHTPHELADAFPGEAAAIHRLKEGDAHFAALAERYHVVNRAIHRAESEVEPVSDEHAEELKRQRLALIGAVRSAATRAPRALRSARRRISPVRTAAKLSPPRLMSSAPPR